MLSRSLLACSASLGSLLIVLIVAIGGNPNNEGRECRIPHQSEHGVCVEPRSCPAFQRINLAGMAANASRFGFVRELQCGGGSLICCTRDRRGSYRRPWMAGSDPRIFEISSNGVIHGDNSCGNDRVSDRIWDGNITDIDEFPWAAQLIYRKGTPKCGGVLISRNFVLTAAHCLAGEIYIVHGPLKFVRLREYNQETDPDCILLPQDNGTLQDCIEGGKLDIEPLTIKLHPFYDPNNDHQHHDIALIGINLTEKYSDFLRPICLPESGRMNGLDRDQTLTVCGWVQEERGNISSPIKMKAKLPFVDRAECQKLYPNLQLKPGQICAGGRQQDACAGDSGSPLMYYDRIHSMWILSGIVSKGPKQCGTAGHPGIYSSVVEYLPWIRNVTGL